MSTLFAAFYYYFGFCFFYGKGLFLCGHACA